MAAAEARLSRWLAYVVEPADTDEGPETLAATRLGATVVIEEGLDEVWSGEWSPSARVLAASVARSEERGVIVARFEEAGLAEPPRFWSVGSGAIVDRLHWSPDGRHLAYRARSTPRGDTHFFIASADAVSGPLPTLSANDLGGLAWSPVGHALAFTAVNEDGEGVLYIAREDDGFAPRRVGLPEGVTRPDVHMSPDETDESTVHGWSPDGRWLAFRAWEARSPDSIGDNRIFVTSEHGSPPTLVTPRLNPRDVSAHGGAWSPNGRMFSYEDISETTEPPLEHERYVVDLLDGWPGEPVFLAHDEAKLRWTPDGRLFSVEDRAREVHAELIDVASADDITRIELFHHRARCLSPALHAAAQRIVMMCQRESPRYDLLVGWQPGAPEPFDLGIIDHTFLLHEGWSPDGTVLAFVGDPGPGERNLYEARFPEGDVAIIERDVRRLRLSFPAPAWSPDSTAYAFRFHDGRLAVRLVDSGETVIVDGGDGTEARAIGWSRVP